MVIEGLGSVFRSTAIAVLCCTEGCCFGGTPTAAAPSVPASAAAPAVVSPPPIAVVPDTPDAGGPAVVALQAFEAGRYEETCPFLVEDGFSPDVCEWIVQAARGTTSGTLSTRVLESFVRAQHVRRTSGSIVGWYDEGSNEYEVRVGGRAAILRTTETNFETTGRFSMWTQENGASEEVLNSGREVTVRVYREWPLTELILEVMRARGDARADLARELLEELVSAWYGSYCYADDPLGIGDCYVHPVRAGLVDAGTASEERVRECRRSCTEYLDCRRDGFTGSECADSLTSFCRGCRTEGAIR